ncbi:peroxiredoxin family protein (plasmid) [Streptomyces sp. NBC_01527]|uniref:peroxiredoxin n=1 Tax=unclassified Streptomyces TaxID=2593676 RepID=UPI002E1613DB|nr:peroxiredoxin family protein [Streptomyces sp. NBC_01230]
MPVPEIGAPAPDFSLPGVLLEEGGRTERGQYSLSAHRGRPVVLAFYPGDDSLVCTKQLCSYASDLDRFRDLGATVWGINFGDLDSHEEFARKRELRFPLLADTDRSVVRAYGIQMPGLGLKRSVFIVDADGIVRWRHVARLGLTYQDTETITQELATLSRH